MDPTNNNRAPLRRQKGWCEATWQYRECGLDWDSLPWCHWATAELRVNLWLTDLLSPGNEEHNKSDISVCSFYPRRSLLHAVLSAAMPHWPRDTNNTCELALFTNLLQLPEGHRDEKHPEYICNLENIFCCVLTRITAMSAVSSRGRLTRA